MINKDSLQTYDPVAHPDAIVAGERFRFTILTDSLIRLEYSETGTFEDRPTQTVLHRRFPVPEYRVIKRDGELQIHTDSFILYYTGGPFTKYSLYIDVKNNYSLYDQRWHFGEPIETLKGTVRTLDFIDGETELEEGIQAKHGYAVIDDSRSFILQDGETFIPRKPRTVDLYFFAHGRNYKQGLRNFFRLTGVPPLLPRYALGNWWSRYWAYTEEEYKELMLRFKKEDIPFTVAVIDMDWHLVDIPEKYGSGWTGYTWNKDLFPDPDEFLRWLHDNGLKVTLNVHPADGVRPHEEMYEDMAKELGVNYENEEPILFDITDKKFREAYFKYLHHPEEKRGVDFWWIDWQQGKISKTPGLDPLWLLNYFHTRDQEKQGKRPLILSRYAGVGSHRYPIGFSGDTVISWDSLRFQPYFTATATNIGYTWWSHDIGGHYHGVRDDELSLRWIQFGVFSPILRLHSSKNPFTGKEPWNYPDHIAAIMKKYLRLRHAFIPYLYTMNWRTHRNNHPLIMPVYYEYPQEEAAYEVPNQYFFGSELMVAPVTEKTIAELKMAPVDVWLPEGLWFDFFTGRVYTGEKRFRVYRDLQTLPVFAKAGAIIPMAIVEPHDNSITNPEKLEVLVFPGAANEFDLYEDDGESLRYQNGEYALTKFSFDPEQKMFTVYPTRGALHVIPEKRLLKLKFRGFKEIENMEVYRDGKAIPITKEYDPTTATITITIPDHDPRTKLEVFFDTDEPFVYENDMDKERIFHLLMRAQISYDLKEKIYRIVHLEDPLRIISELNRMDLDGHLFSALLEYLLD